MLYGVVVEAYEKVLQFWLGELDADGLASSDTSPRWWKKSPAFDEEIRNAFAEEHRAIMAGEREAWLDKPRSRLAYVIVLDQFSRNMFRDTPAMFASDERAREATRSGIARGHDSALAVDERVFLYMPLMHGETLADQDACVALFDQLAEGAEGRVAARLAGNQKAARAHRAIIAKWGRFPHRNRVLGRASTPEEVAFLEQPGSSF
jgi:uncharacterized protein (DUF924 family)